MNERIKELIEQCTHQVYDSRTRLTDKFDKEKFAELLVRECSNFLKDTLDDHFAAEALEKHFEE